MMEKIPSIYYILVSLYYISSTVLDNFGKGSAVQERMSNIGLTNRIYLFVQNHIQSISNLRKIP
jgi:hypothetical protein